MKVPWFTLVFLGLALAALSPAANQTAKEEENPDSEAIRRLGVPPGFCQTGSKAP